MTPRENAEATIKLLCAVIDSWDLTEAAALHRLPLTVVDRRGTVTLNTSDELRAMYQGVRKRFTELGGVRMESEYDVIQPPTPGLFLAETVSKIYAADGALITEFCVSHVMAQIGHSVQITTQVVEPDKPIISPAVICECTSKSPSPMAA